MMKEKYNQLLKSINEYVEKQEQIDELVSNLRFIKKKKSTKMTIQGLENLCENIYQFINKTIDELNHDEVLELQISLNETIATIERKIDNLNSLLDSGDSNALAIFEKIDKLEMRKYLYQQLLDHVNTKNSMNYMAMIKQYNMGK